ncbi:ATP-dependent nuclease [Paenibacillus elgii]|uniref:ATP-dependent nuclease n=1 Tax=Paenibacillus elgii TaxID=189691 RepID=UPI00030E23D2|nr:AAA family ATPase [Paenibacillus elgii]
MQLYKLKIEGYRRHMDSEVLFSDATFLIGENNVGKSSILSALNLLLNDVKKISDEEFYSYMDGDMMRRGADKVVLTAEFRRVPEEAKQWMGFKGRVLKYINDDGNTELRVIYRKTFTPGSDCIVELRQQIKTVKTQFSECSTINQYIEAGLDLTSVEMKTSKIDRDKKLTKPERAIIEEVDELYDYDEEAEEWFKNPGGIPANVLSRLPKFLLIPAQDKAEELSGNSGTLVSTLVELFNDVRDSSENYKQAQQYLNQLAEELNPANAQSEFGQMMTELNLVMKDVFPNTGLKAVTSLSDADKVIKPQFTISMFSNITTSVNLQGTGIIRSAVFALLRYRNLRNNRKTTGQEQRPLIIGFEEPEIYLHPNAAKQMRDTIYDLAGTNNNQIVCTTHSPYMIDLSKKPLQILNCLSRSDYEYAIDERQIKVEKLCCNAFNTSEEFLKLQGDDKTYVKMLLKLDDHISRVFFSKHVLIVEGDTEDLVLRETLSRLPEIVRKDIESNWQIVKARGKATIIALVKYLRAMGINPFVIHDKDEGNERAEVFNAPILDAIGDENKRAMLTNCIEDVLGYDAPSNEKPYKAFNYITTNWTSDWDSVSPMWKLIITDIFRESFSLDEEYQKVENSKAAASMSDI